MILSSATLFAQTAGLSFMFGYPQGEFRSNVNNMGYGIQQNLVHLLLEWIWAILFMAELMKGDHGKVFPVSI